MRIRDFTTAVETATNEEIDAALEKRYEGNTNAFWLSHGDAKYPALLVMVEGPLASLHYFPRDRDAGLRSRAEAKAVTSDSFVTFHTSPREKQDLLGDSVVAVETAIDVAKEFSRTRTLPTRIQWMGL